MSERPQDGIPFSEFMQRALYGPEGFYSTAGHAGRRGDFLTSVEVGPLFGAVVARYLDAVWRRVGSPDPFFVVEAGAGVGTLARSVHAAQPTCWDAVTYVTVEVSEPQRLRQPDWVVSLATMPRPGDIVDLHERAHHGEHPAHRTRVDPDTGPVFGVVIANELLDNLPFDLVVFDGGWRRAFAVDGGGRWFETLGSVIDPVPTFLPPRAAHGARAPLQGYASQWVRDASDLIDDGSVLAFDYGVGHTADLAMRPWREWLRTYRRHERGDHYLAEPGSQDITVDVALDQLPEPTAIRSQSQWLQLNGIDELVAEGKAYWEAHAGAPDLAAMKMRSRVSESEALLDPDGLGGFWALEWVR